MTATTDDSYNLGYNDALTRGPSAGVEDSNYDPVYVNGFRAGVYAINNSLPACVHHLIQLVSGYAFLQVDATLDVTTPPLGSFSRRSLHLLLQPVRDKIVVTVKGGRRDRTRRVQIRFQKGAAPPTTTRAIQPRKAHPSPMQVRILHRSAHDGASDPTIVDSKAPDVE